MTTKPDKIREILVQLFTSGQLVNQGIGVVGDFKKIDVDQALFQLNSAYAEKFWERMPKKKEHFGGCGKYSSGVCNCLNGQFNTAIQEMKEKMK